MSKNNTSVRNDGVKSKIVTLHHHHTKAYRKRHLLLLSVTGVIAMILLVSAIQYRVQISNSITSSHNYITDLFSGNKSYDVKIHSTLGFDMIYNQEKFYATGIDATSGDLFTGADLNTNRPYSVVRISPSAVSTRAAQSALTLTYHQETTYPVAKQTKLEDLQDLALKDATIVQTAFDRTSSQTVSISGQIFLKSVWQLKKSSGIASQIQSQVVTYVAVINNHPVTMTINYGLGGSDGDALYKSVIESLHFGKQEQNISYKTDQTIARIKTNRTLLDSVAYNNLAYAASQSPTTTSDSERVAALYSPAVVKIYNVYCMDINVDNKPYLTGACDGVTGSGFFVSQDGYLATNGHVATSDPKSISIQFALSSFVKGDERYLDYLASLTDLKASDISEGTDADKILATIVDKLYNISDSHFTTVNSVSNLLVGLSNKEPDLNALINATDQRREYSAQNTIKRAKLVASNFRAIDGIDGFRASDVALIKIDGRNYPITKLGSIGSAIQGSELMILGYPGNATDNGLVDANSSTVTLTTGKVSSVKNAAGSTKKLIETDTTIGHGNSGGPALTANGEVVGIATYTADGAGAGMGVFNYIRDIKDLQDLAQTAHINFDTNSATQSEWQQGMDNFYTAHYSKALQHFDKVKSLYPDDSKVDEFTTAAKTRIANGEDVKDFPVLLVTIIGTIMLIGSGVAALLIVRHKKHHNIYKNQVNNGTLQPMSPGVASQQVTVPVGIQPAFTPPAAQSTPAGQQPSIPAGGGSQGMSPHPPVGDENVPPNQQGPTVL